MRNVRALSCLLAAILVTASGAPAMAVEWAGRMGGGGEDSPNSITVDPSGNSLVTGFFQGTAIFGSTGLSSAGGDDIFVEKLDPQGVVLWARRMGGGNNDGGYGIAADSEGNCYVTGFFRGTATFGSETLTSAAGNDIFVVKLDPDGHVLWAKRMGGSGYESGHSIAVDTAGNSYVTGYFQGNATFGTIPLTSPGLENVFVQKLDPAGTVLWAKRMGGTTHSEAKGIALDPSGNSYVTGHFDGTATFGPTNLALRWRGGHLCREARP